MTAATVRKNAKAWYRPAGTLNVYRDAPNDWERSALQALHAYAGLVADNVGSALAAQEHSELAGQLQYALEYRVIIERAVGYVMGTHRVDAVTAFNVLRKRARDERRRVAEVAAEILPGGGPSGTDGQSPG